MRLSFAPAVALVHEHRWSTDERLLAVWSEHAFAIFDVVSNRAILTYEIENHAIIINAEFSPDGRWFAVASHERDALGPATLRIFSVERKIVARTVETVSAASWQIGPDNHKLTWLEPGKSEAEGMYLRREALDGAGVPRRIDLPGTNSAQFWKIEGSQDGSVSVLSGGEYSWLVDVDAGRVHRIEAWSDLVLAHHGDSVAWANKEGFQLWSPRRERPLRLSDPRCRRPSTDELAASRFVFSDDERSLASSGGSGACIWDTNSGQLRTVLRQPGRPAPSPVAWFNGDRGLVVDSVLWDVEQGRRLGGAFSNVSVHGSRALSLEVPDEPQRWIRLQSVDAQFTTSDVAKIVRNDCSLDLTGGQPLLVPAGEGVWIACDKKPVFVDLGTREIFGRSAPGGATLATSPLGKYLTIITKDSVTIAEPTKDSPERQVMRREDSVVGGFDAGRLWLSNSPEWQKFNWASLEFGKEGQPRLVRGTVAQDCGKHATYSVGSHFVWSSLDEMGHGVVLCDMASGRRLGELNIPQIDYVPAVNADGTLAVVTSKITGTSRFWYVAEQRTTAIKARFYNVQFSGPRTIVGLGESGIVTVDALTGAQSSGWTAKKKARMLAADIASQRILISGKGTTLFDLESGNVIAEWPTLDLRSAAFGPKGLLVANDEQRIHIWQLPSTEQVGELLIDAAGYLFMHSSGKFETTLPTTALSAVLTCNNDARHFPVEYCARALREPGLMARVFSQVAQ